VERTQRDQHGRLHYQPQAGDVVILRRPHVCGADRMVVTLVGLDVRLRCSGCAAQIMLSRERLSRRVREVEGSLGATPESP
jgi:hypothetical protein